MRGFKRYALVLSRVNRNRSPPGEKGLSGVSNASLGFYTVWVAHLGRRYGILQALSRRKRPAGTRAIARACGLHAPAVRVWCEAARTLGLIQRTGDGFRLPADRRALLADADDVRFLGGQFSYLALRSLDFEAFDAFFRRGEVGGSGSRHLREASEEATRWDHVSFLKFLLPRVPGLTSRLRSGARALDVGCGTGGWVLRMARAFPRSSFTGIDPDRTAIRIASGKKEGGGGRVRFRIGSGGGPMRDSGPFDLAYLGEVLYGVKDKLRVLRNVARSLARDGVFVLAEGLLVPARKAADPAARLVGAMGLDFALQGSRFFERSELEGLLREAGFHRVRFHDAGGGLWFVVATADSKRSGSERGGAARHPRGDR
jgi:SAM-dependent methyltransferase